MRRELQKAIKRKAEREKEKEAREDEMVRPYSYTSHLYPCIMLLVCHLLIGTSAKNERG